MRTSSRMAAKSSFSRWRSASLPDCAMTRSSPRPASAASRETRFSGVSSTRRIFIRLSAAGSGSLYIACAADIFYLTRGSHRSGGLMAAHQSDPEHREELIQVDRLGDVIRSAGLDALGAVAL